MYYGCVNPCVLAVAVPLLCESRGGSGLGRLWPDSLVDLATADAAPSGGVSATECESHLIRGRPWGGRRCWDGVCAAQFLLT